MIVYRIKHKPTGLFISENNTLSKDGCLYTWKPTIHKDLGEPILHIWQGKKEILWVLPSALEIKEYELED
ncbi:hypothetical protein JGH11_19550 [Dysgonomonas sp. Marseille-P4677]|uniref:hypothetical protein n=1 Tax=Dysgonomonas sp. Marseille-P4677 TaxID=2364790 RepID=UPI0019142436|nr:hypothetical protein [Dysgonomonas sp. Marseille-P4677]MBK5723067.1 hypothetical protein [Dysgonomonas sp. Marseille-P4677]